MKLQNGTDFQNLSIKLQKIAKVTMNAGIFNKAAKYFNQGILKTSYHMSLIFLSI